MAHAILAGHMQHIIEIMIIPSVTTYIVPLYARASNLLPPSAELTLLPSQLLPRAMDPVLMASSY
jgi:hypothetical protein